MIPEGKHSAHPSSTARPSALTGEGNATGAPRVTVWHYRPRGTACILAKWRPGAETERAGATANRANRRQAQWAGVMGPTSSRIVPLGSKNPIMPLVEAGPLQQGAIGEINSTPCAFSAATSASRSDVAYARRLIP